jgi:ribosomal protein L28
MTVGSQVKQSYYSLISVEENLKSLALRTEDEGAKVDLEVAAKILKDVTNDLNKRVSFLEREEPQYKGF